LFEAMQHTNNQVIFASGTNFPDYSASYHEIYQNNQANNMYIFPGLELGILLTKTKIINDFIIYEAAKVLAESLTAEEKKTGYLYPNLTRIQEVSQQIAAAVKIFSNSLLQRIN
jgi:malate dehydrogenase (oxaloacetate-decarboxylating)(NADP+)